MIKTGGHWLLFFSSLSTHKIKGEIPTGPGAQLPSKLGRVSNKLEGNQNRTLSYSAAFFSKVHKIDNTSWNILYIPETLLSRGVCVCL